MDERKVKGGGEELKGGNDLLPPGVSHQVMDFLCLEER